MSQNIKLTGVSSFSHPSFKAAVGGDVVHIKKGDVVKVTDDVADRLLDRVQRISEEDVRHTFTETSEKAKYNFAGDEVAAVTGADAADESNGGGNADETKPAAKTAATQRRARTK